MVSIYKQCEGESVRVFSRHGRQVPGPCRCGARRRRAADAHPVSRHDLSAVVARRTRVEHGQHLVRVLAHRLQKHVRIRAVALARRQRQIAEQIASVQPRQRQAISITYEKYNLSSSNTLNFKTFDYLLVGQSQNQRLTVAVPLSTCNGTNSQSLIASLHLLCH